MKTPIKVMVLPPLQLMFLTTRFLHHLYKDLQNSIRP